MTQHDIGVQADETEVTFALRKLAAIAGWCVTHTTDGAHSAKSYHYEGRAVDLAAREGPGYDSSALLAINEQVVRLLPLSLISELIYSGPGNICVKNGRVVAGLAGYGREVMNRHHDHVHLAVVESFTYSGGTPLPDDPNLPNIVGPVELQVLQNASGECTGYFIFSHATGELHAFGPGTKFYGRSEVVKLVTT